MSRETKDLIDELCRLTKEMRAEHTEMILVCRMLYLWLGNVPRDVFATLDEEIKDRLTKIIKNIEVRNGK